MIGLRNLKIDEVGEWVKGLIKEELLEQSKKAAKKAAPAAKKAAKVIIFAAMLGALATSSFAKILPRGLDDVQSTEPWKFGSCVVLAPNPSSAITTWVAQTGMIYYDSELGQLKIYNGTSWTSITSN